MIPLPFPWLKPARPPVPENPRTGYGDYRAVLRRTERLDPVTQRPVWPLKRAGERS